MALRLPEKIKHLSPYQAETKHYQIMLNSNESFIDISKERNEKLAKIFSETSYHRYPDPSCSRLREAYASLMNLQIEQLSAGNGSDELIWVILSAFLEKDARILIFPPDFSMYHFYASLTETCIFEQAREAGVPDLVRAVETIREKKIQLVLFSNPGNPSSVLVSREEVLRFADAVDCLVVVDEAYMDFSNQSVLEDLAQRENLIVLRTCSKAVGLAGLRLGFAASNAALSEKIRAAASPYSVNVLTQALGASILEERDFVQTCIQRVCESRDSLQKDLNDLCATCGQIQAVAQSATNFCYIETQHAAAIFEALKEKSILVRLLPPKHLRISCGTQEENRAVMQALREILLSYNK